MDTNKLDKVISGICLGLYLDNPLNKTVHRLQIEIISLLDFHSLPELSAERAYVRVRVARKFNISFHSEKYL